MKVTNVYEAKTKLSQLIEDSLAGQDVVIGKFGRPLVKLVPYTVAKPKRHFGILRDKIHLPATFDDESQEVNALYYGNKDD